MNDLSVSPWFVDTPGAVELSGKPLKIEHVQWVSKAAVAGDDVEITDKNGARKWASVAAGANTKEGEHLGGLFSDGLKVPTLDSGYLLIDVSFVGVSG